MITQSADNLILNDAADLLASNIPDFMYDPAYITFSSRFKRVKDTFEHDFSHKDDAWKSKLLLRKLVKKEHERFTNFILLKQPSVLTFAESAERLTNIFHQQSLFHACCNRLKLSESDAEDEDYKELLTINTHKVLYRYIGLPLSVKSTTAIFQQKVDAMLISLAGAVVFIDGIIIAGATQDEFLKCLFSEQIQQYGFHMRGENFQFFSGGRLSTSGLFLTRVVDGQAR